MWAIVPIKRFDQAKRRLASVLAAAERRLLMLAMARDVLTALAESRRLAGVLLVSRAAEADALATTFGTHRFAESEQANLPQALGQARDHAVRELGAAGTFIVPADTPLIESAEIDQLISTHQNVTLLPDSNQVGTNGLICTPPDAIPFVFDGKSFNAHAQLARDAGLDWRVVPGSRFALDIDRPDDLARLLGQSRSSQTAAYLRKCGVAERLQGVDNKAQEASALAYPAHESRTQHGKSNSRA